MLFARCSRTTYIGVFVFVHYYMHIIIIIIIIINSSSVTVTYFTSLKSSLFMHLLN